MIKRIKLSSLTPHPDNPLFIKDEKFNNLVNSIKEFPKMMNLRPIIRDENNIVLAGNMRLKALEHLGYKTIPMEWVRDAKGLTKEEMKRFIVADNVGFGEWDWSKLIDNWSPEEMEAWSLDLMQWAAGHDVNSMTEEDLNMLEEFDTIGGAANLCKVVFIFDDQVAAEDWINKTFPKGLEYKKFGGAQAKIYQVNKSTTYGIKK